MNQPAQPQGNTSTNASTSEKLQAAMAQLVELQKSIDELNKQESKEKFSAAEDLVKRAVDEYEKLGYEVKVSRSKTDDSISKIEIFNSKSKKRGRAAKKSYISDEEFETIFKLLPDRFKAGTVNKIVSEQNPSKQLKSGYLSNLFKSDKWSKLLTKEGKGTNGTFYVKK